MITALQHKKLFALSLFVGLGIVFAGSGRAHAATLAVDSGCTLSEAITAVNGAADGSGCVKTGSAYGTDDTVNIPAGTITTSADLPVITKAIHISGSSTTSSSINMNGHDGFHMDYSSSNQNTKDTTIEKMSITGAIPYAINIKAAKTVTLDSLDIADSNQGVSLNTVEHTIIKKTNIHDNTDTSIDQDRNAGLVIDMGSYVLGRSLDALVEDSNITNNTGDGVGMYIGPQSYTETGGNSDLLGDSTVTIRRSTVSNNTGRLGAGIFIITNGGPISPTKVNLGVDATTVAHNTVTVVSPQTVTVGQSQYVPIVAGFMFTGVLTDSHHFTNVTVAYNTVTNPAPDNRNSTAGFLASIGIAGSNLNILNTTVVGNHATQPSSAFKIPSFFATKIGLSQAYEVNAAESGSSATNVLVAQNTFNGSAQSCLKNVDTTLLGFDLGDLDLTPVNLGHNMSDDQTCTGYTYDSGLYDTMDHEVKDNGGPVPTIKLLSGSPAINAGGQVLGISTDARGVAREGYYSVGAYQGVLLAASTTNGSGGTLAVTGAAVWGISIGLAVILLSIFTYTYIDYRKHRKPLVEVDPDARHTYTYAHHIRTVTLPVMKYRINISLSRKPSGVTKF